MKHMSRLICAFGCLAMLSDIAPGGCVARADLAGPTYVHRLQRVGYEVLAEPGSFEWFAQKIEVEWRKNSWNGSEEHAKKVLVEVLRDDSELRLACTGIPLELIVERYFVTEQWYRAGRHSFTHPKTMPGEFEAQNRRDDATDAAVNHEKFCDEQ